MVLLQFILTSLVFLVTGYCKPTHVKPCKYIQEFEEFVSAEIDRFLTEGIVESNISPHVYTHLRDAFRN